VTTQTAARLRRLAALATQLAAAVDGGVLDRMAEWSAAGPRARGLGSGRAGADPTGNAALAAGDDLADLHARSVVAAVEAALSRLGTAQQLVRLYPVARVPDDATRARLAALDGNAPAPGCWSCARIRGVGEAARWEPADSRLRHPTDAGGILEERRWLCRWCNDTTRRLGRLPTHEELARHHSGRRVNFADTPRSGGTSDGFSA
jgi:hypothetical protein